MSVVTQERVPDPLEWHPAYADMTNLLDWLNGTGSYADRHVIQVPYVKDSPAALRADADELFPTAVSIDKHTLTKRKCGVGAPYVGRPFKYLWTVATDELGRAIAADSERWYDPLDEIRGRWTDPYEVPLAWWEDD